MDGRLCSPSARCVEPTGERCGGARAGKGVEAVQQEGRGAQEAATLRLLLALDDRPGEGCTHTGLGERGRDQVRGLGLVRAARDGTSGWSPKCTIRSGSSLHPQHQHWAAPSPSWSMGQTWKRQPARFGPAGVSAGEWRWRWDLNPRRSCPLTRFRGVLLRPLGHATAEQATRAGDRRRNRSTARAGHRQRDCPAPEPECDSARRRRTTHTTMAMTTTSATMAAVPRPSHSATRW